MSAFPVSTLFVTSVCCGIDLYFLPQYITKYKEKNPQRGRVILHVTRDGPKMISFEREGCSSLNYIFGGYIGDMAFSFAFLVHCYIAEKFVPFVYPLQQRLGCSQPSTTPQ